MSRRRSDNSTSSKTSSSTGGEILSSSTSIHGEFERGSLVWCKYKKYPYWPGIVSEKSHKSTRSVYEILFFGTFSVGLSIDSKWLEPFEGAANFKKRLIELRASEIIIKNRPSQYDMNISLASLESFQEAIKQATKLNHVSNSNERIELAEKMRQGATYDFFQLDTGEDVGLLPAIGDDHSSSEPILSTQNNQQFMQTMITQGKNKRVLDDDSNLSPSRKRRMTIKTEPDQPLSINPSPPSILLRQMSDRPMITCSNFVCHSLSPTEETFIMEAIMQRGSACPFFEAKHTAEEIYANIIRINNTNRTLPVSDVWFYLFVYLHFEQLFSTHLHWLENLEKAVITNTTDYLRIQQEQIIRLMKTHLS